MSDLSETQAVPDKSKPIDPSESVAGPTKETNPTAVQQSAVPADQGGGEKKKWRKAAGDAFRAFLPERVTKLEDRYGPALFVGFCIGLIVGIGLGAAALIKSETLRALFVSTPPIVTSTNSSSSGTPEKPDQIEFSVTSRRPDFLVDYENLLGGFGEQNKPPGMIDNPPVGTVVRQLAKPTQEFKFSVKPRYEDWQIYVRLFRQTRLDNRETYEPLLPIETSPKLLRFKVGECRAGDKLYMVVLAVPPLKHDSGTQLTDYFKTEIE